MLDVECPQCGSGMRRPISPGYWECLGTLVYEVPVYDRGPAAAPTMIPQGRRCGHRYADGIPGTATLTCSCGTFAIGLCTDCGQPVCGDCGDIFNGKRRCGDHLRNARFAAAEQAEAAQVAVERQLIEYVNVMQQSNDPTEVTAAILALPERHYLSEAAIRKAWITLAGALEPQLDLIQLIPAQGLFATRKPPMAVGVATPVYAWPHRYSYDPGDGCEQTRNDIVFLTSEGEAFETKSGGSLYARQPWHGLYVIPHAQPVRMAHKEVIAARAVSRAGPLSFERLRKIAQSGQTKSIREVFD